MSDYTFSTSAGFCTSQNIAVVNSDIDSQIPGRTLTSAAGDCLTFTFSSDLDETQKIILQTILRVRDPPPPPVTYTAAFVEQNSTIIKHEINGVKYSYIGSQENEIHISKGTQGHYSSVKAAIAANPDQNTVFIIHPGNYPEDNPLTLAPGMVLVSCGNAENTFITAQNTGDIILNISVGCKVEGITFRGSTTGTGLYFDGSASGGRGLYSAVMECFVKECEIGVDIDGKNIQNFGGAADTLYCRELLVCSIGTTLDKAIYTHDGGQFIGAGITVYGVPPILDQPAHPIMYGYYCTGLGSKISMSISNCYFCGVGMYLDSDCQSELTLLTLKYNGNGVIIGPSGTKTRFSVNSLEVAGSVQKDITVLAQSASIEVHSGVFDDTKILNPNGVRLNMRYHTNKNGNTRQRMLGIINVGTPTEPAKMFIGEGYYDIYGASYLQNNNNEVGAWVDITASAIEDAGSTFGIFSSTAVGSCLYIGRDKVPIGVKMSIVAATSQDVSADDVIFEYWNGTDWVQFHIMQTEDTEPYSYVDKFCVSMVGSYHIRFGLKSNSPLVAKTLNGVSKKWVRIRIVNALPSIPTSNYILAHTNVKKINSDGYVEYYGDARSVKKLNWNLYDMEQLGGVNQIIYLGKKLYTGSDGNKFTAGQDCEIALSAFVPTDIDVSFHAKIIIALFGTVAGGTTTLNITYNFSNSGVNLYTTKGDSPDTTNGEKSVTITQTISDAGKEIHTVAMIEISHINMNPSGQGPQILWLNIARPASDAYTGDVVLTQLSGYYVSWMNGAHLISF
jgi:hypothetical protein